MWGFVIVTTLATVAATVRMPRAAPMLVWITWAAVTTSLLKSFVPPVSAAPVMMEALFVIQAASMLHLSRIDP